MSRVIVYAEPDGAARIVSPGPDIERARARCVPKHARHVAVLDTSQLPDWRELRDAWVWDGQRIVVDPSRIKPPPPPPADQPAAAPCSDTALRLELAAALEDMRQELARHVAGIIDATMAELKRWVNDTQLAVNSLKRDEEVPTQELQAVREGARALLGKRGDWRQVALAIMAERNAELVALLEAAE